MKNSGLFLLVFSLFFGASTAAQVSPDTAAYDFGDFGGIIYLDSLVVTASRSGFDVEDFVNLVQEDKSFYQAFRNLRFLSYSADNSIEFFDKKQRTLANYQSTTVQKAKQLCREMQVLEEKVEGKFFKKKRKYRYYTAKLYDRLFFTHTPTCESSRAPQLKGEARGMDKHIRELKKLIFQPGSKAEVPIIGNRTAIFDPDLAPYYDFKISSREYKNGQACYVFTAVVKEEFMHRKQDKTIIKFLETYFEKGTLQVIARNYQLKYQGALFDFEVSMNIELRNIAGTYAPEYIRYVGAWDVPGKKPEICHFSTRFYDFK